MRAARAKAGGGRPFVFVNAAMSADGKISPSHHRFVPFGGARDRERLLELRATADAVMAGARTIESFPMNLGPGPAKYRRERLQRGLAEYNLRVIVSGRGNLDPRAAIFRSRFSPIIVLTTDRAPAAKVRRLREVADEVKAFGRATLDFPAALRWLRQKWGVRRLLCEGGGELNGALFRAGLADELYLTICPQVFGGRDAPTLADGPGAGRLEDGTRLRLKSLERAGGGLLLAFAVKRRRR